MRKRFGAKAFDFVPETYVLPKEMTSFSATWRKFLKRGSDVSKVLWIMKPAKGSGGEGISVFNRWKQPPNGTTVVVQRYIERPFLINQKKFDMRVYVFVASYYPLRVYVHEKLLVRFATEKYSVSNNSLEKKFVHLTSPYINEKNKKYRTKGRTESRSIPDYSVHKWPAKALWSVLLAKELNVDEIWKSICAVCVKTIASVALRGAELVDKYCASPECVNQLLGFDLILDANAKVWLLEVNTFPDMSGSNSYDYKLRSTIATDYFNISGIRVPVVSKAKGKWWGPKTFQKLTPDERKKQKLFTDPKLRILDNFSFAKSTLVNLTQDDITMLCYCVDEWRRASFGGFKRVYPLSRQDDDLKLINLLQKPKTKLGGGGFRYYDLLVRDFLTHFHYNDPSSKNAIHKMGLHTDAISFLKHRVK
ncbi:Tubulin polyglutamylase ttll4 [Cichlidogyrus casuarinus]|uniref:Tubulin polyglutamylase ttll4 n=1 Tax=Cichlidogyrus casuarinus TaxID=1844966 RepID=A0ABD2PRT4_9PLAT